VLGDLYRFFTQAAFVTFGGAYAVLAYVAQVAVDGYHWLRPGAMLAGLGLAETTPGPLIMVLQFVGFQAGWNHPGSWPPLAAATAGALVTTWVTFLPSIFFILLGAPFVEQLRGVRWLAAALAGVTAAVVGVILNLAVLFGRAAFFPGGAPDGLAILAAGVALAALARWRLGPGWLVLRPAVRSGAGARPRAAAGSQPQDEVHLSSTACSARRVADELHAAGEEHHGADDAQERRQPRARVAGSRHERQRGRDEEADREEIGHRGSARRLRLAHCQLALDFAAPRRSWPGCWSSSSSSRDSWRARRRSAPGGWWSKG
jgi:chromate transport protein ChrA